MIAYIESSVLGHARTQEYLEKFPRADVIEIERYSSFFNRKKQDFRLQKKTGTHTIIAKKHQNFVQEVFPCKTLVRENNYYFSHLFNCPFDCEYCYLQGMYSSANLVYFVNFEDFESQIREICAEKNDGSGGINCAFFSGYDSDSLALDHVTGFAEYFIAVFESIENAEMELRTKSVNITNIKNIPAPKKSFVTWTLSPPEVIKSFEKGAASFEKRMEAIEELLERNWRVQLRFEPILYMENWEEVYGKFLDILEENAFLQKIERVSIGHLRFPKQTFKSMKKKLPSSQILAEEFEFKKSGIYTYPAHTEAAMTEFFKRRCCTIWGEEKIKLFESVW